MTGSGDKCSILWPIKPTRGARRCRFSENPRWSRTFDKVSYSHRKWFSHWRRKGVIHSCGKRGNYWRYIFSRGDLRYDLGCLRYIKDTSDLLCPQPHAREDIKRRDVLKQYRNLSGNHASLKYKGSQFQIKITHSLSLFNSISKLSIGTVKSNTNSSKNP